MATSTNTNLAIRALMIAAATMFVTTTGTCESKPADRSLLASSRMAFVYPVMGPRMSSDYGSRKHPVKRVRHHHAGIDLAAPVGAPIRAIADGQVIYADPHGGYGKFIVVRHQNDFTSHYGHCDKLEVHPGQRVSAGQVIGTVGNSGRSTGPHLHFEIRKDGVAQNPERYLPGLDDQAAG